MNNGKICVSVCAETADELIRKIKLAEEYADIVEVRFDCLNENEIVGEYSARSTDVRQKIIDAQPKKPIISTFRPKSQGGKRKLSFDERRDFWNMGFDGGWADLEEDVLHFAEYWLWNPVIASFHDFSGETSRLNATNTIFERLAFDGVDIVKIAVNADDIIDSIPIWHLLKRARLENKETIPIAMGEAGKWTRILGLAHGAFMTYAALDNGAETAAGQFTAKDLVEVYRVKEIDLSTKVYGVIGDPVSASLSPYIHNPAFIEAGINAVFIPFQVKDLDEFIRRMVRPDTREVELNFAGFSVTMPHKQLIIRHLDDIDPVAEAIGAVNTIKIDDGKLTGYNTDAHGFITPLKAGFGDLRGTRVGVLGAGGAARACVYALKQEGAVVTILARDVQKAKSLTGTFDVGWSSVSKIKDKRSGMLSHSFDILVNATPLGMRGPRQDDTLFTAGELKDIQFVYDLVTRGDDTPLVRAAKLAGVPAIGGLEMLLAQGAKQFEMWTGRTASLDNMSRSLLSRMKEMG